MPRVIYIGRTSKHHGKRVYEILSNLKNFGIGRILASKTTLDRYPEALSYCVVKKVAPQMDDDLAFGRIWVEEVFRGKKFPQLRELETHHPDYKLIPRDEEAEFLKGYENPPVYGEDPTDVQVLPKYFKVPPLMAEFLNRKKLGIRPNVYLKGLNRETHGYDKESLIQFKIPFKYPEEDTDWFRWRYRVADEDNGEKPTVENNRFIHKRFLEGIRDKTQTK